MSRRSSREPKQNSWYKLEEEDAGSSNSLSSRASPRGSPVPSLLTKPFAFPALTPATTDGAESSPQFPPSSHAPDGTRLRRPMNSFLLYSNETRPKLSATNLLAQQRPTEAERAEPARDARARLERLRAVRLEAWFFDFRLSLSSLLLFAGVTLSCEEIEEPEVQILTCRVLVHSSYKIVLRC